MAIYLCSLSFFEIIRLHLQESHVGACRCVEHRETPEFTDATLASWLRDRIRRYSAPCRHGRRARKRLSRSNYIIAVDRRHSRHLECEDLVLELADGLGLLEAKGLGGLLEATDHGWRTAEQNLDIIGRFGEPFL